MRFRPSIVLASSCLLCVTAGLPANAASTSAGASLQIARPEGAAQTVRGVRRESVDHESFTAAPGEILEIVLADGSSVTLASGASVTIDSFNYDRATRLGELTLRVTSGLVRVTGGVLNNTSVIRAITPQGEVRIDNAIASIDVHESASDVALLLGRSIVLSAGGQETTIGQPHTAVRFTSTGFDAPRSLTDTQEQSYAALLNPGLVSGVAPQFIADESEETEVSSDKLFAALNEAKDADVNADVQQQANTPPPPPPAPPPPQLNDVSFGLPGGSAAPLGGLQWGPVTTAIDPLANAGGDSDQSVFYWVNAAAGSTETAPRSTVTLFGGGESSALWSTPAGVKRETAIEFDQSAFGGGGNPTPTFSCTPSCGYGFATDYFSTFIDDGNGGLDRFFGGDAPFNYLLVTFRDTPGPAPETPFITTTLNYMFRMRLGTDWTLPGSSGIQYVRRDGPDPVHADVFYDDPTNGNGPFPDDPTDTYFLQSGFASTAFTVQKVAANTPGCVVGPGGTCYTITGATAADANPCAARADSAACSAALIDLATKRIVSEEFDAVADTITYTFADGVVKVVDDNTGLLTGNPADVAPTALTTVFRDNSNHFLLFEANATGNDDRRFLFATGHVLRSAGATQTASLDKFLLSPGVGFFSSVPATGPIDDAAVGTAASAAYLTALDTCATGNCALSARAFFRSSTVPSDLSGKLYDSGLLVFNPAASDSSSVFHVDFGLKGSGSAQVSTIGGLFGALDYTNATESAAVSASLVGSTYGPGTANPAVNGITALGAPIVSTAAGGGNTRLGTDGRTRAGHLVLETGDAANAADVGKEHPINSANADVDFSATRLASATGTAAVADGSRVTASTKSNGYLAGLALADSTGAVTRLTNLNAQFQADSNLELTIDPTANTVAASVAEWTPATAADTNLGGTKATSAYIDNKRFGAADGTRAGLVSGAAVLPGWTDGDAGLTAAVRDKINGYQYLQWGFFFGDSSGARDASSQAHLASWVTGKLTAVDAPKPAGTAIYEGHMLGNVAQVSGGQTSLYTAIGTFTNTWDFGIRQGDMAMQFDGAEYAGKTIFRGDALNAAKTAFEGTNNGRFAGSLSSATGGRSGMVNGSFIDDPKSTATHVGVIGRFDIGTGDGSYTASGTFAGEKKPGP